MRSDEGSPAKRAGRKAVREARTRLLQRAMESVNPRDREALARLTAPGPQGRAAQLRAVEELLERAVERHPSMLGTVGLSAIQALAGAAEEAADAPSFGTSRPLTVVFTDLEGFTEWTAREGDEAASRLLAEHHAVVDPLIAGRGGRLVKRLGDGLLITFPQPAAAVLACLDLVDHQPEPLRLRAGLHAGRVVETRDDVIGHVVNLAARVAEAAEGSEVLVTADVSSSVELDGVRFGETRSERFKGIGEPITICSASWA
ncbi:MAG TPA: adenylate/guanylate cyclase domain-containing protein [Acidimicrobiales bacterium]|nr:adenylate/guanylate cyclase domain-containing protein [Acidimicrobiales bacterium]